jgi:hypothetical protein
MNRQDFDRWAKEQCIADVDAKRIWEIASAKCEPSDSMIETATAFAICEHIEMTRNAPKRLIVEEKPKSGGRFFIGCVDDAEVTRKLMSVAFSDELERLEYIRGTMMNGLVMTFSLNEETTPYTVICKIKDDNGEFTMTLRDFSMKK